MYRSLKILLTWSSLTLCSLNAHAALENLLAVIPADSRLVVTTPHLGKLIQGLEKSPYNQAAIRSDVHHALGDGAGNLNGIYWDRWMKKNSGYSLEDFAAASDGALVFISPDAEGLQGDTPSFTLIVELGEAREAILALLENRQKSRAAAAEGYELREFEEEHFDETLHLREYVAGDEALPGEGWALFDGKLVLARPAQYLRRTVESLKVGSAEAPWSEQEQVAERLGEYRDNDLSLWVAAEQIVPFTAAWLRNRSGEDAEEAYEDDPELSEEENAMMRRAQQSRWTSYSEYFLQEILPEFYRIGLHALQLSLNFQDDAIRVDIDYQYGDGDSTAPNGLISLRSGSVELPEFIYQDTISVSVARLDIAETWRKLEAYSEQEERDLAGGMVGGILMGGGENDELGEHLLAGAGELLVQLELPPPGPALDDKADAPGPDSLVMLSIKDRAAMESALNLLKEQGGWGEMMEAKEYLNTTIYSLKAEVVGDIPGVKLPAFAISDRYVIYGDRDAAVRTLLSRIADPNRDLAYAEKEDFKQIMEGLEDDYATLAVEQPANFMRGFFRTLRNLPSPRVEGEKASCGGRPKLKEEWFAGLLEAVVAIGYSFNDGALLRSRYHLIHGGEND